MKLPRTVLVDGRPLRRLLKDMEKEFREAGKRSLEISKHMAARKTFVSDSVELMKLIDRRRFLGEMIWKLRDSLDMEQQF